MRAIRSLCVAGLLVLTACGDEEKRTTAPRTATTQDGQVCPAPPPRPICDTTKRNLATSLEIYSTEHHVGQTQDMSRFVNGPDRIEPCVPTDSIFEPDDLRNQCRWFWYHGTRAYYRWKAWCVPNPNAGQDIPVQTDTGLKMIKAPDCLARAERPTDWLAGIDEYKHRSGGHKHSGYWYNSSCSFEETRANPKARYYCFTKGSASLNVWPYGSERNTNHYGDSVLLGIAYGADHTDANADNVQVSVVVGYGPAGVLITPGQGGGRDWSHHTAYVVDLECGPSASGSNRYTPRRKPARPSTSAEATEPIASDSGER